MAEFDRISETNFAQALAVQNALHEMQLAVARSRQQLGDVQKSASTTRVDIEKTSQIAVRFGSRLTTILKESVIHGRRLDDTLRRAALSLSNRVFAQAFRPLENAIDQGLSSILSNVIGFRKGGVFAQGHAIPFARGGVVSSPVAFSLGGRRLGIAGEAGPEAILPLARGPDGRLGVESNGAAPAITINFNVTAEDAGSFRRSESQITAMLNRAVSRGARNL